MGIGLSLGGSTKKDSSTGQRSQTIGGYTTNQATQRQWDTTQGQTASQFWTPDQQKLASQLSGYLGGSFGAPSAGQQAGQAALMRGATGQGYSNIIDPQAANQLYAAIEKQTMEDILPKATNALAGQANMAGMLRSGPALQMQLNQRDQIVNELSKTLAGLRYSDESQRREIEREREGRQLGAGQALLSQDPQQAQINNIMQLLGIRGGSTEQTTGTAKTSAYNTALERIKKGLMEEFFTRGNSSGFSAGLTGSFL